MVKNPPANAGDIGDSGLIPGSRRFPGGGNGNPLQCFCLGNPMDRGARCATVNGVAKSWTQLSTQNTVQFSRLVVSNSLWPHGLFLAKLICPWYSPGKDTGVGCQSLLQGIFPTQGPNASLSHCRPILYHLSHQGIGPKYLLEE